MTPGFIRRRQQDPKFATGKIPAMTAEGLEADAPLDRASTYHYNRPLQKYQNIFYPTQMLSEFDGLGWGGGVSGRS